MSSKRRLLGWVVGAAAQLAACREQPAPGPAASASAQPVRAPTSAAPPASSAPAAPARTRQVEALLERWRAAQKNGDFAAYEQLYAQQFAGIKRVGAKAFRFNRQRWLLDRKGMLAHRPDVAVAALDVTDLGKTVVARFEQTYSSKGFRDVGTKLLVLVDEGGELEISREEMLSSVIAAPPGVVAFPDFAFVVHHGGRPFALLEPHEREPDAPVELVDFSAALSPLDEARLPASRRLANQELVLFGNDGELCRAKVKRVVVLGRARAHFGQVQQWQGELGDQPRPPRAEVALSLFELAGPPGSALALELGPDPRCEKARWARGADRPAPAFFPRRYATPSESSATLAAFHKLDAHRDNQASYEGHAEREPGAWYRYAGAAPKIDVHTGGGRFWTTFSAEAGSGCGDYYGQAWAVFEQRTDTSVTLASDESDHGSSFSPATAVDVNGDSLPEFLGSRLQLLQMREGRFRLLLDAEPPDFDCGC